MIKKLGIKNFRCINNLELNDMGRVTLLTGRNNVGKSSILESIFMFLDHASSDSFQKVNGFRQNSVIYENEFLFEPLFYNQQMEENIEIKASLNDDFSLIYSRDNNFVPGYEPNVPSEVLASFQASAKNKYALKFQFVSSDYSESGYYIANTNGVFRSINTSNGGEIKQLPFCCFVNSSIVRSERIVIDWVGRLEIKNKKEELLDAVRILVPDIKDIFTVMISGQANLYIKTEKGVIPFSLSGDGTMKLLYIVLCIIMNPDSIILIDEVENGLHYSAYKEFWAKVFDIVVKYNCQVIATSHSYECLESVHKAVYENPNMENEVVLYRIEKEGKAYRYDIDIFGMAIEGNSEVR